MLPRRNIGSVALLVTLAAAVAACGDVRKQLGVEKKAPDEFAVVRHAPLSLPPNYVLRPPAPGERRPQEKRTSEQARVELTGVRTTRGPNGNSALFYPEGTPGAARTVQVDNTSIGEASLLSRMGVDEIDPQIRATVNRESAVLASDDRNLVEKLMFWRVPPEPGTVVDADKEKQRIRKNAALGKEMTEGETPTIERKTTNKGVSIFN